jgi:hypothetical protein
MQFRINLENLRGKEPDYGGSGNLWLLKHHMDSGTVHSLCTEEFSAHHSEDVEVEEVTTESLKGHHSVFADMVRDYWTPYGNFENIDFED